ncbi:MAG: hypothetical protein C0424_05495 [Sphingobacteriaceae bacterium]|nr:hypothetical protein [Sphingobacteriaceae bacterium]
MKTLEYLYCKYYAFQVRIGHRDIAPLSAALIIAFTIELYYFGVFFISITLFTKEKMPIYGSYFKIFSIILLLSLIVYFYLILVHKGKYKEVLKRSDAKNKSSLGAILFPLIAFILFNAGWILKMLQNQGKL